MWLLGGKWVYHETEVPPAEEWTGWSLAKETTQCERTTKYPGWDIS